LAWLGENYLGIASKDLFGVSRKRQHAKQQSRDSNGAVKFFASWPSG
jgi:hypothetical protein